MKGLIALVVLWWMLGVAFWVGVIYSLLHFLLKLW